MNLKEKYPEEFSQCFDFSIREHWIPVVEEALIKMIEYTKTFGLTVYVFQVKEKFGGLRFYYRLDGEPGTEAMSNLRNIVRDAEMKCSKICDVCGEPGEIRTDLDWMRCLCDKHYQESMKHC